LSNQKNRSRFRWIIIISLWTFILAVALSFVSHYFLNELQSIALSFVILLLVVLLGILFDLVGTAAAAADIAPLNAKAARRVDGSRCGVYLVKNAEKVATFCNDVGGDISGIISGTLVTVIVIKLVVTFSQEQAEFYVAILLTALIAALTVGGKAWGKIIAINYSTEVIMLVGLLITKLQRPLKWFRRSGNDQR